MLSSPPTKARGAATGTGSSTGTEPYDYKRRFQKEQEAKSRSVTAVILLGVALGVIGTIVRIKLMAANPPPRAQNQNPVPIKPTETK